MVPRAFWISWITRYPGPFWTSGPPGSGNLTLCSYVRAASPGQTPETYAIETVERTEPNVGLKVTLAKSGFVTISM